VTCLTAIFGNTQEKTEKESEKLLNIYWNSAELKKELANLRSEQFRLKDCIKRQEGSTARIQQKLEKFAETIDRAQADEEQLLKRYDEIQKRTPSGYSGPRYTDKKTDQLHDSRRRSAAVPPLRP